MSKPHTLVLGGGAIGLSVAWELLGRGHRVTLVERDRVGRATSWAAAGILPPAPLETAHDPLDRLRGLSHQLFPRWVETLHRESGIDPGFRRSGGWYLAETPGERAAMIGMRDYWRDLGIECVPTSIDELCEREPALAGWTDRSRSAAAWWVPDECQIRSPDFLSALAAAIRGRGGRLREACEVSDVRGTPSGVAVTAGGASWRGDFAVLCGGVWSGLMAPRFGLEQSLVPVRGQISMLKTDKPPLSGIVNMGHRYLVCRDDGRTLVGSSEEEVGFRLGTTEETLSELHRFARRVVPVLADAPIERSWSGLRPMTFDGFPMIGRVPDTERFYVAAGHFRSGIHLSCATAVTLADLMTGRTPAVDAEPFRVGKQQHAHASSDREQ